MQTKQVGLPISIPLPTIPWVKEEGDLIESYSNDYFLALLKFTSTYSNYSDDDGLQFSAATIPSFAKEYSLPITQVAQGIHKLMVR